MQIILQYKKLWGKLETINIIKENNIKANIGKYTRKGREGKKCKGFRSCQRAGKDRGG